MTAGRSPRLLGALLALAVAGALGGCGNKKDVHTEAASEGFSVHVGELVYQVQISRQLNPRDVEDRGYLSGLEPGANKLSPDEQWVGIFLRVRNDSDHELRAADQLEIRDTTDARYVPVRLSPVNAFSYQPRLIPPDGLLPEPSSPAAESPIQGALVLFKLKVSSLQNRPLQLFIRSSADPANEASVDLDL